MNQNAFRAFCFTNTYETNFSNFFTYQNNFNFIFKKLILMKTARKNRPYSLKCSGLRR